MEWLKKSQRGSRNQQHRGHWVWPDPQWNSTGLQDRKSSSPWTPLLRQQDNNATLTQANSRRQVYINDYLLCFVYCQVDTELGRGTLLDSNGPKGRGHSVESCLSSTVLQLQRHLGSKTPADTNLDKDTVTPNELICSNVVVTKILVQHLLTLRY